MNAYGKYHDWGSGCTRGKDSRTATAASKNQWGTLSKGGVDGRLSTMERGLGRADLEAGLGYVGPSVRITRAASSRFATTGTESISVSQSVSHC